MINGVKIVGVGHGVPEQIVDNIALESIIETSDEWIQKRTGIKQRRLVSDETVCNLAQKASEEALEMAGVKNNEIELIIAATITNDTVTPSLASNVQKALGIERAAVMDVGAGCSGFIYALATAHSLMKTMGYQTALVVAAEALSRIVDWEDRGSCILFGDASGAVVLKADDKEHLHYPVLSGKPDVDNVLFANSKTNKHPFNNQTDDGTAFKLQMDGREVFTFANGAITETLDKLTKACGDEPFEKIVMHQANYRMADYVCRKTQYNTDQFFLNLDRYANTSSASIPLAMWDAYQQGWLKKGDRIALVGFGAGLSWAGLVVDWSL